MRLVATGLIVAGCTASADSVSPPADQLFFPTAAAVDPGERVLFVANANSDLQYSSGTVSVLDLARIDDVIAGWTGAGREVPDGCAGDTDHLETIVCDEAQFILTDAVARTGNFATAIAVQDRGSERARLIIPTRGDPSITWLDWDGVALQCHDGTGFESCDDIHRLAVIDDETPLPSEPFDAAVDSVGNFAIVTHLTSGAVTLVDSPPDGNATIADVSAGFFLASSSGNIGASGIAIRRSDLDSIVYVGSNFEDRIQTLTVGRPVNGAPPFLLAGDYFFLDGVGGNSGQSTDTRSLVFDGGGERLYTVNRDPPSVQVFDTSTSEEGTPRNRFLAAHDICRLSTRLAVVPTTTGDRLFATCFQDGQVYIVDPQRGTEDVVTVGRGAFDVAVAPTRGRVYVTNFLEDTVAVLDVAEHSVLRDRVVLRIGIPRNLE